MKRAGGAGVDRVMGKVRDEVCSDIALDVVNILFRHRPESGLA